MRRASLGLVLCLGSAQAFAAAPPGVDGVYRGTRVPTRQMGNCGAGSDQASAAIKNGVIERNFMARDVAVSLKAEVKPDGTFSDQQGKVGFAGRVANGTLEFDLSLSDRCAWHYTLQKER